MKNQNEKMIAEMRFLKIYYEKKEIAIFDTDQKRKPRESEVVASIANALLSEMERNANGSGAWMLDSEACRLALDELSCGEHPLEWKIVDER